MPSVKKNFAWSTILTVAGYIFPLITFPYVSRVLGAEGIGNYQHAYSIIDYFCVFSVLGMGSLGIREIAKVKGDRASMSKVFSSLLVLNLITTFLAIAALVVLVHVIPSFQSHSKMLYIGIAKILCNTLLVEWFFKGIEDFRYITIRAVLVRCIYVISVFVFVRESSDYVTYFLLTTLTVVVNAIINIFYLHNHVDFSLSKLELKPHVKPFVILGVYKILTAMYTSFNVMYLGAKQGDVEVGFYSTATKLYVLIMSVFTAFTGVMLPRMSSLIAEGKTKDFNRMTSKSIDFLLLFCLPIIMFSEAFAPSIIRLLAGPGFEGAIMPMRIVMPLMLVIGYEQIVILQMLMPLQKDGAILTNSIVGAGIGLLLNIVLVPFLASVGSAIAWCGSEIAVLLSAQYFLTKYTGYQFPYKKVFLSVIAAMPALAVCLILDTLIPNWVLSMIIGLFVVGGYCICVEYYVMKNDLLRTNLSFIFKRFIHSTK